MAKVYSLVFTKEKNTSLTCDTEADYGIVCLEGMPVPSFEAKDVYQNDWPDEHGVEIYDSGETLIKATDITIPMGVKGTNYALKFSQFLVWLTTNGSLMTVSCPYTGFTLKGARFVKVDPEAPGIYEGESVLQFKLTLKITKPDE